MQFVNTIHVANGNQNGRMLNNMKKIIKLKRFECVNMWNNSHSIITIGSFLNKSSDVVTLELEYEPLIKAINVTFRNNEIFMCLWCDDLKLVDKNDNCIARYNIDNIMEW